MGASLKSKTRLTLQDEYEKILQQLKHHALGEDESTESISSPVSSSSDLATDLEIQILKRISEILCSNDCLDICIDIFERAREASRSFIKQSILRIQPPNRRKLRWFPPPQDGSVSKLVRYAINYLKYLATEGYNAPMAKVLRTEQIWKVGVLSKPDSDKNLLKEAITNIVEALQRNIESKRSRYKDKVD
ncbi:Exocyst complex component EXO70I [Linum perenne]